MSWSFTDPRRAHPARGVAFVEALLVLAVITALWLGVRSLTRIGRARLEVAGRARHCAWQMARTGCSVVPPECEVEEAANSVNEDSKLDAARRSAAGAAEPAVDRRVDAELDDLPGSRVRATASRRLSARPIGGGHGMTTRATVSLPCAPRTTRPGGLSREIFDSVRSDD